MRGVPSTLPRAALRLAALTTAAALGLSACSSGSDSPKPAGSSSDSSSASSGAASPSATVSLPPGVDLTAPGAELDFGAPANVAFENARNHRSVLQLRVLRVQRGRISDFKGFILPERYQHGVAFYYATVSVRNVGTGDLGGTAVPLWGVSSANVLLPVVSFTTRFARCPSGPLPRKFAPGASLRTCLVFLALNRTRLTAVSYRPNPQFNPIVWKGAVSPAPAPPKPKAKPKARTKNRSGRG
jgi:hypothetical protein